MKIKNLIGFLAFMTLGFTVLNINYSVSATPPLAPSTDPLPLCYKINNQESDPDDLICDAIHNVYHSIGWFMDDDNMICAVVIFRPYSLRYMDSNFLNQAIDIMKEKRQNNDRLKEYNINFYFLSNPNFDEQGMPIIDYLAYVIERQ